MGKDRGKMSEQVYPIKPFCTKDEVKINELLQLE